MADLHSIAAWTLAWVGDAAESAAADPVAAAAHDAHEFLATLALVLCAAAVTTVLFQRLKQPVVLGYLLAGMVIGPNVPIPLEASSRVVHTLAELGVILLMFSLGIEFSLRKLIRVGATAVFVAAVQCSLMVWLGYLVGQAFGWSWLASLYAGAVISISSTTIIVKAFQERGIRGEFTQIVFGVLIVEDLIAILLITTLTALSVGEQIGVVEMARTGGKLALFLLVLFVAGLLTVPRAMRLVDKLDRTETTVVASVGLAFGFASLASYFGYSVALGAFIAGSLVSESGVEQKVEHLVQPVRDIFAAIFFVSVGMLIEPRAVAENWLLVAVFLAVVVVGKVLSVSLSAFLTGQTVQNSVKSGMSLAQIGEFSFIIAGVGLATGATDKLLYSVAVAVSGITTLLTPWLIRAGEPLASWVDRKLPRPLQTFVGLYGSWMEQLRRGSGDAQRARVKRLILWLAVDAVMVVGIIIGAAIESARLSELARERLQISPSAAQWLVVLAAVALAAPFWVGIIRVARYLGFELASRVFPGAAQGRVDTSAAPRRLLVVTLQLAIVLALGVPLLAITQPFLPPFQGGLVLAALLALLALSFWRGATNFQGHAKAAAQAIAEALAQQTRDNKSEPVGQAHEEVERILSSLGSPEQFQLPPDSPAVGRTLAAIALRGLTGATVLAIRREGQAVSVPSGVEKLHSGDILAIAGTREAIEAAKQLLRGAAKVRAAEVETAAGGG